MTTKYTPGPWKIGMHAPNGCPTVGTENGLMTAMISHSLFHYDQAIEAKANAKLIAAAPDLLNILEKITDSIRHDIAIEYGSLLYEDALYAIKKAIL